jgi:hypothetical protein
LEYSTVIKKSAGHCDKDNPQNCSAQQQRKMGNERHLVCYLFNLSSRTSRLAALYAGIVMLGILTIAGFIGNPDGLAMFNVARSIAHKGSFEASPCEPAPRSNHCVPGVDGRLYSGFGLLPSAIAALPLVTGEELARLTHQDPKLPSQFLVSMSGLLVGALIPIVLVLWLTHMGFSWQPSVITALLLFFGTVLWFHSVKNFYSEPFFTLALLAAAYLLSVARRTGGFLAAGIVFGCGPACRVFGLILAPVFVAYCIALPNSGDWARRLYRAVIFGAGALLPLGLVAWANYLRFGDVTKTGYHLAFPTVTFLLSNPLAAGARGLLFDGAVGLLWFTPWIVLVPFAMVRFWKVRPLECALSVAIMLESFLFFSCYVAWNGGWAYGPRLLLPALPFAILPLVILFEHWRNRRAVAKILIAALAIASVFIQLSGLPYPATRFYQMMKYSSAHQQPEPWHGSLVLAQLEEFPTIVRNSLDFPRSSMKSNHDSAGAELRSEEARIATMSAEEYLASFPNPINIACANLWLVKASKMGVPWPLAGALSLGLLASGIWLLWVGVRPPTPKTPRTSGSCSASRGSRLGTAFGIR